MKQVISTNQAPEAIGTYSQAIKVGKTVYISGQIPLQPGKAELIQGDIKKQLQQIFANIAAIAEAAGGSLNNIVKLNVYLIDLKHFPDLNAIMSELFTKPYPARAAIGVAALPKGAEVEVDAILEL